MTNIVHTTYHEISMPYTTPASGIIIFVNKLLSTGEWYDYYSLSGVLLGDWYPQFCGYGNQNHIDTRNILLSKGATIKNEGSNNITHIKQYFVYLVSEM